jgi:hypothetical protein
VELKSFDRTPRSLAIDHEYIYYLDGNEHSLRRIEKHGDHNKTSEFHMKFQYDPSDIVVRNNYIDAISVDLKRCDVSKDRMIELKNVIERLKEEENVCAQKKPQIACIHGGILDEKTSKCVCKNSRYDGEHCEIDLCYNYCLNGGECSMEQNTATCSCRKGFNGNRCENNLCLNYCMNGQECNIDDAGYPSCRCSDMFYGNKCQYMSNEESASFEISSTTKHDNHHNGHEVEKDNDNDLHDANNNNNNNNNMLKCPVRMNLTYIILGVCLTLSLLFFLIILLVIQRFHKPMRPKIRKKYVVHKNIESMTCRPTTEQCEVIIEDCCNMNICDTVKILTFNYCLNKNLNVLLL